jgi:hypothetical protein
MPGENAREKHHETPASQNTHPGLERDDKERTYLEQLLATRVNLYLLFVSFYFVAVFGADPTHVDRLQRSLALAFGGLVSLGMALSVMRTTALVELVLDQFRATHTNHPYTVAYGRLEDRRLLHISANYFIAALPWIVTAAFFTLAWLGWYTPDVAGK